MSAGNASTKKGSRPLWFLLALAVIASGYGVVQWLKNSFDVPYVISKCERRIVKTIDPSALQAWATNLLDHYPIGRTNYNGPFRPMAGLEKIWEVPPSVCILGGQQGEEPFVCIRWGAAAGHWGLSVGSASFVPHIPEDRSKIWKPGVYFWQDLH
jgi:hypothetical protein